MPSPAIMSGSISRRPAAERRSSSCTNSRPTTPTGSRRCAISRAATAASPIPRAAIRRPTCRRRPSLHLQAFLYRRARRARSSRRSPRRIWSACRWAPIRRCRSACNAPERALSMTLAGVGSGSEPRKPRRLPQAMPGQRRAIRDDRLRRGRESHARGAGPDSVPAQGPARTRGFLRGAGAARFQGLRQHHARLPGRPALDLHPDRGDPQSPTPALIICGDEDDACVEPSLFLKKHLPAAGLTFFPKSGHVLNLEEPALFNEMVERFIALVEAGRWPVRDPRSMAQCEDARIVIPGRCASIEAGMTQELVPAAAKSAHRCRIELTRSSQ